MVAGGARGAPVGTWTVLFTDQVGSTAMRVRVGEEAFDRIRADLDAGVGEALRAHGVVVTKSTGDGVMGGFTSTAAALRCAVAIQQAVAERNGGGIEGVAGTESWSAEDVDRVYELTGGVPLLVHEQASEWVRGRASRRMTEASDRVAVTRRRLVASRGEIAGGVEGIQRLLEQRRAQLAGREAQLQASAVAALGGCPYKGLARFEQADAANFFGRERLVAELVAHLPESPLLAVVGPSGSGKSSLVRAGPLPALAAGVLPGGQSWRSTIVCPGPHPARELAHCLDDRSMGAPQVLFVDQFEETFTAGADRHEQEEFIGRLLDLDDQADTAVVLAIRADHLGLRRLFHSH